MRARIIIACLLVCLAGFFKAVHDNVDFRYPAFKAAYGIPDSQDHWWSRIQSHGNKWQDGDRSQGEKFPGSSTIFVFTQDAWHCAEFLMIWCVVIAAVIAASVDVEIRKQRSIKYIGIATAVFMLFTIVFEIFLLNP